MNKQNLGEQIHPKSEPNSFHQKFLQQFTTNYKDGSIEKVTKISEPTNSKNIKKLKKTRWSPRTRMPTRMLTNRYKHGQYLFVTFPAKSLVRHHEFTHWGDTLVGHPRLTLLRNALVRHSSLTLLWGALARRFLLDTLVRHSYLTFL